MTTPTNFQRMPGEQGCYNGRLVMGSGVAQMALALKQLTNVKFRAAGYYPVGRTTWQPITNQYIKANYWPGSNPITKGATDEHDLFYFSQPTSQWIGLEIVYGPSTELDVEPEILCELYEISGGAVSTKIDEGILFTSPEHLERISGRNGIGYFRANTGGRPYVFPSAGISAPTIPRPLYIPSANRGDELVVRVTATDAIIFGVYMFDLYLGAS
jgi:hypothetical protein